MFYGADTEGDKEFTISSRYLREIKHGLNSVGERREISAPYFRTPSHDLLRRMKDMGLDLTENKKTLGKYVVCRIK